MTIVNEQKAPEQKSEMYDKYIDDPIGKYLEVWHDLRTEKQPYVDNAVIALNEYMMENCDFDDPLKSIIDQGRLQLIPALPTMTIIGTDDDGEANSIMLNKILETWIRKDKTYATMRDVVLDGLIKSSGYVYEYIAEEYSGNKLTYY